jgi:hypothetical protein
LRGQLMLSNIATVLAGLIGAVVMLAISVLLLVA